MEGAWFKNTGNLVSLSEEQLLDCDKEWRGCGGGEMSQGIEYVIRTGKCWLESDPLSTFAYCIVNILSVHHFLWFETGYIDTEESYPYKGVNSNFICKPEEGVKGAFFQKVVKVPASEEALKIAVATQGPISVGINVDDSFKDFGFRFHNGSVYYGTECKPDFESGNHGVAVVGYGTEDGKDYWLVKNSWGSDWGEEGYIKMARNKNNNCGIATDACYAVV